MSEATPIQRAMTWLISSHDTGISSEAICARMVGGAISGKHSHPRDPADFGRCARLLLIIPEWRARVPEMAACGPYWATLVARWSDIEACMEGECGLHWEKQQSAPVTFDLMQTILDAVKEGQKT